MRTNLPVTPTEYPFPKGQTLVTTTDTKGRILYCNPMFVEVSGFDREELLGQPHNIIRHPDMPEEAFRDMWKTISSGRPWSAPVKNRRKDGSYYWVMANATPLVEDGHITGYMSVRTEASKVQVAEAEALYTHMRQERERGRLIHCLEEGRVVRKTLGGKFAQRLRLSLSIKLLLVLAVVLMGGQMLLRAVPQTMPMSGAAVVLIDIALVLIAWRYITTFTVRPLPGLIAVAQRMAAGDLTQQIASTRNDEIGTLTRAMSQLNVNLRSIVRDAREQSASMMVATQEIAQGNKDLAQRTEAQASNLEETAASMEQITSTVRQTAEISQQASTMSSDVSEMAAHSGQAVQALSVTMGEIQDSSKRIAEITQVIDSIAFQTNILALNAAVEAARAAEHGRGFAVVASEVRTLAQRTSAAAREIRGLIEDSSTRVAAGHSGTEAAKLALEKAVQGVHKVHSMIGEISTATSEQLTGIAQINSAVNHLDSITQQNAALVEEVVASAISLDTKSQAVHEAVRVFRIDGTARTPSTDAVLLRTTVRTVQKAGVATRTIKADERALPTPKTTNSLPRQ
jgi:aerotaxis receptor